MTREDMVDVKLTAAGEAMAAGCMRIHGVNYEYCFLPGKAVRMSAAEFASRLQPAQHQGQDVFEVVAPKDTTAKRS